MLPMPCGRQIVDVFASHGSPPLRAFTSGLFENRPHVNTKPVLLWVKAGAPRRTEILFRRLLQLRVYRCPPGVSVRWKKSGIFPVPTSTASKVVLSSGNLYFLMQRMRSDVISNKCLFKFLSFIRCICIDG